jgi:hypothetical protein
MLAPSESWLSYLPAANPNENPSPPSQSLGTRINHSNPSANTPCATLLSAPLRSVANKYGTSNNVVGVANRRLPTTARAKRRSGTKSPELVKAN